jgi:hypothetical protein
MEAGPASLASSPGKRNMPEPMMALTPRQSVSKTEIFFGVDGGVMAAGYTMDTI